MKVEIMFKGGVEIVTEVSNKYSVLSEMMYSDERFTNRDYDKLYCELVNQCIEEIVNNCKISAPIIAIINKETQEEMMADEWA